ncbi:hypothetical protein K7X08_008029 [Anisodus acutangulus]|uniref:Ku domain-containing protein n=1 Tax=Anisodus acutangulus TaxID=402998 RepID=A0A9Q1MSX3_9SOLA|nr:hypothetical protein K7X08_008029 [Anisodus acutangulus]
MMKWGLSYLEFQGSGDFLDAIVVGMDMLIKKFEQNNKGKKRLCLITNAATPIEDPFEGTKEDQVNTIATQMEAQGMKMDCVIVRMKQDRETNRKVHLELVIYRRSQYTEEILKLAQLKIKVWVYKKTSEEKFPTLKKYSDKAPPTDKFATHEIKVPNKVVPPEERIKGFQYGPQVVPISPAELEAVKFKPEKSVKLLGFTDASNIMRHYYLKDVNIFIAEPGNKKSILALSALARAMKEMNKVAIIRCVWRQGQGIVVVGVLTPNVSDKDNAPDSFYFIILPCAENVREFQFPSFINLPSSLQPNEKQQHAADKLVQMLDLAPPGKQKVLPPDFTPNPVLERYYRYLDLKSKHPDVAVPPLDETLQKTTEPDIELLSQNKSIIEELRRSFELKDNPKLKKSARRVIKERPSGSDEEREEFDKDADAKAIDSMEYSSKMKVEKIGDVNPVKDFEEMMSRRDDPKWINKAIQDMKNRIFDLVENSCEGDTFHKALQRLVALRKGCILEQEPKQFNDFLCHLCKFCQEKNLRSFCQYLTSHEITLITKAEAPHSDIPEHDARSFMVKPELDSQNMKSEAKTENDIMSIYLGGK